MKIHNCTKNIINYRRLKEINRCNNFQTQNSEDDAQHSFYVAFLSNVIAVDFNSKAGQHNLKFHEFDYDNIVPCYDVNLVTQKALFHDIEEVFVSDIPHNVKHYDNESCENVNRAVDKILDNIATDYLSKRIISINKTSKCKYEGELVDTIDMLELGIYCCEEYCKGNNLMMPLLKKAIRLIKKKSNFNNLMEYSVVFCELFNLISEKPSDMKNDYAKSMMID